MATYRTILTNKGIQLVAAAGASGTPIVLTDMAVGDGNGNPVTPDPTQTSLARERYRHALNQLVVDANDASRFIAELIIPASIGGFTIREVGLYTAGGDLFAVANVPNAYKPTSEEGSFGDTVVRMVFIVSNASVITLVVDPNVAVATQSWVMNNVNAATIIPGGLTGQYLAKNSNADGDTEWVDPTAGITVIVFSREETQTLAAGQTVIDLAEITAEGAAVYIEGTRLRADEFSQTGLAQITLGIAHPDGTKVTVVQNEEVGSTDVLLRPQNLADVPDKALARNNLGLPNWLATSSINWNQLTNLPDYAARWPTFTEVTDKPATYPPSAHNQDWTTIDNKPDTATRWPTWNEVTSKPSLFPPAAHTHVINDVTGLQTALDAKVANSGGAMTGQLAFTGNINQIQYTNGAYVRMLILSSAGDCGIFDQNAGGWGLLYRADGYVSARTGFVVAGTIINNNILAGGTIAATGGFDFGSSITLKDVTGPCEYGLADLMQLDVVRGRYKPEFNDDGRDRLFLIAEQLLALMPETVNAEGAEINGEKVPAIKVEQLLPVFVRAFQQVAARLRELEAR